MAAFGFGRPSRRRGERPWLSSCFTDRDSLLNLPLARLLQASRPRHLSLSGLHRLVVARVPLSHSRRNFRSLSDHPQSLVRFLFPTGPGDVCPPGRLQPESRHPRSPAVPSHSFLATAPARPLCRRCPRVHVDFGAAPRSTPRSRPIVQWLLMKIRFGYCLSPASSHTLSCILFCFQVKF